MKSVAALIFILLSLGGCTEAHADIAASQGMMPWPGLSPGLNGISGASQNSSGAGSPGSVPFSGEVGYDVVDYLYSPRTSSGIPGVEPTLDASVKWNYQGKWVESSGQAAALLLLTDKHPVYADTRELYVGTSERLAPVQVSVGRRLVQWNHIDDEWGLGIWQPRFRRDYLNPESVGLAGGYLTGQSRYVQFTGFGSPIFIPDRGVPVETQNGQIQSDSQWFTPPPSSVTIFNKDTPVVYQIAPYDSWQMIHHPAYSAQLDLGRMEDGEKRGPWFSAGYAYKPMNQLLLGYEAYLDLAPIEIPVTLYPRVLYHHLNSFEAGYSTPRASFWVSTLLETPVRDVTPADWTTQEVSPSQLYGAGIDYKFDHERADSADLGLSYLRQLGGNAPDQGPYAGGLTSVFEARYPYQSAFSLRASSALPGWLGFLGENSRTSSRLLYDIGNEGAILSEELQFRTRVRVAFNVGADLLAARSDAPSNGTDFIHRYQTNNRVHAGVSYAF